MSGSRIAQGSLRSTSVLLFSRQWYAGLPTPTPQTLEAEGFLSGVY